MRFPLGNASIRRGRTTRAYLISKTKTTSPERPVRIHAHQNWEDEQLLPGTFVWAVIETNRVTVLTLLEKAVVQYEAQAFIFVAADSATKTGIATYRPARGARARTATQESTCPPPSRVSPCAL